MRKYAIDLAKEYEFNTADEYYQYIIDSVINGQRQQARDLFNELKPEDQQTFLIDYCRDSEGIERSTKNICIAELCK